METGTTGTLPKFQEAVVEPSSGETAAEAVRGRSRNVENYTWNQLYGTRQSSYALLGVAANGFS